MAQHGYTSHRIISVGKMSPNIPCLGSDKTAAGTCLFIFVKENYLDWLPFSGSPPNDSYIYIHVFQRWRW